MISPIIRVICMVMFITSRVGHNRYPMAGMHTRARIISTNLEIMSTPLLEQQDLMVPVTTLLRRTLNMKLMQVVTLKQMAKTMENMPVSETTFR